MSCDKYNDLGPPWHLISGDASQSFQLRLGMEQTHEVLVKDSDGLHLKFLLGLFLGVCHAGGHSDWLQEEIVHHMTTRKGHELPVSVIYWGSHRLAARGHSTSHDHNHMTRRKVKELPESVIYWGSHRLAARGHSTSHDHNHMTRRKVKELPESVILGVTPIGCKRT